MAAEKKPAANAKKGQPKKRGKAKLYLILPFAILMSAIMFPTAVLIFIGLIPTYVAFFVDKDREHSAATAIGAMNCAGITPFVIDLWMKGQTMGNAFQILSSPNSWLIILGASAIGQAIVSVIPQAMTTITFVHAEVRLKNLKNNLEILKNSWGPEVGTTKPLEQIVRMD